MGVGLAVACEGLSGLDRGLRVSSGFWFRVDKCVCVCVCVCVCAGCIRRRRCCIKASSRGTLVGLTREPPNKPPYKNATRSLRVSGSCACRLELVRIKSQGNGCHGNALSRNNNAGLCCLDPAPSGSSAAVALDGV